MIPVSQITNQIYIGSVGNMNNLAKANPYNINAILNCTEDHYRCALPKCWYWCLHMPDEASCHYSQVLSGVIDLHKAVTAGRNILVHCKGGVSRSRSIVIAYFVLCQKMSWKAAKQLVLAKRPLKHSIHPVTEKTVRKAVALALKLKRRGWA
jgi:protein-tyrosine phosphatase